MRNAKCPTVCSLLSQRGSRATVDRKATAGAGARQVPDAPSPVGGVPWLTRPCSALHSGMPSPGEDAGSAMPVVAATAVGDVEEIVADLEAQKASALAS